MATTTKFTNVLDTEYFGDIDQQFFLDLKKAKNNKHYIPTFDYGQFFKCGFFSSEGYIIIVK